ncbi:LptF/LptG family permease [Prevotella sp. E9-3]|uniref:LptF/LptG family permease n=1 Tax=Prevotella sp. E9-3 TaxID=2913621 RepID=UPI001EDBC935|nr:LptF/LptG family permease [Prevotella sp. E9-3]UKK49647.1 LptF/LptG family permease [Prevotella sp. E9-3]
MLRIKKLDIFIAKQFGLLFAGTFFICQFVLMMQFLWRYVDELIGKGLTIDVLAKFFWYMGLMLMPQAFPLAILLSSLIAFGNLGESSELTAIKAAGISLMQAMRSLIFIVICIAGLSYFFQDVIGPEANRSFGRLLLAMKQTSPELEIPEGIFYDGLPETNLYVQKKDLESGHLYGIMIYRRTGSYEDQAIILADSGMLQSTAEKKHLLLTLWNGEWFENMRTQDVGGSAEIPYRRETFSHKTILLDYDGGFNMDDVSDLNHSAKVKSNSRILHDLDSLQQLCDSVGKQAFRSAYEYTLMIPKVNKDDSIRVAAQLAKGIDVDSIYAKLSGEKKLRVAKEAVNQSKSVTNDLAMKTDYSDYLNRDVRMHKMEAITKITLSLSCIIFFFIGAPLGAIIRKGGLGVPVIVSVLVFIVYYIFENSGMRMARADEWTVWFGKWISTMVLAPLAIFFTYKANKDSTVFNIDAYRMLMMRMLGLRQKRNITRKEVIVSDPDYALDAERLKNINAQIEAYSEEHKLLRWPSPIKVFFRPGDDHEIQRISDELEEAIEDLGYSRNRTILHELNNYPILATHAHTRPFERAWLNVITGLVLPVGIFFYCRMIRYRLRLYRDLRDIKAASSIIIPTAIELSEKKSQ